MQRLIIGFALIALVGASRSAFADDKAAAGGAAADKGGGDDNVQYKAKTVYDFEDDTVEGDLSVPTVSSSAPRRRRSTRASSRFARTSSPRC